MHSHDSNVRPSVRQNETDKPLNHPLSPLATLWQRINWPLFLPIAAAFLHVAGGLWLLVLTAAYVQTLGWCKSACKTDQGTGGISVQI